MDGNGSFLNMAHTPTKTFMNRDQVAHLLQQTPFLRFLDIGKLKEIAAATQMKEYAPGQIILQEGEMADAYYLIVRGDVRIFTLQADGQMIVLARKQDREGFGEQAFSSTVSPRRTASAEAIAPSALLRIPREALLNLTQDNIQLRAALEKQFPQYIKEKIEKLVGSTDGVRDFTELCKNTKSLEPREVLYRQDAPAHALYVLLHGSVELRKTDADHRFSPSLELGIGEMFALEALEQNGMYEHTAVAKMASEFLVMDARAFKKCVEDISSLLGSHHTIEKQAQLTRFGKSIQFRGQYLDMPTFVTLIFLPDGRQIFCEQAAHNQVTSIHVLGKEGEKTYLFSPDQICRRELFLQGQILVGMNEIGRWDDTDQFLERIVNKQLLSEEDLQAFQQTGTVKTPLHVLDHAIVCQCMRVSRHAIDEIIKQGKCTFKEVQGKTHACTVCGSCRPLIDELLGNEMWMPCRLELSAQHRPHISTFRLIPLEEKKIAFSPGQHIIIKANIQNAWVQRSYTLTSTPGRDEMFFEITVKKEEKGVFSPWLFEHASQNPTVYLAGPYGDFVLKPEAPAVCFAGGIGITPFFTFSNFLFSTRDGQGLYIDYSARHPEDFIFQQELETATKGQKNAQVVFRQTGAQGKITEPDIVDILRQFPGAHVYICGPENFEDFVVKSLKKAGVSDQQIHVERFLQSGAPPGAPQMITF
jgi:ferredoxin-NADP reductase/CRP-like cAMP-binding protein